MHDFQGFLKMSALPPTCPARHFCTPCGDFPSGKVVKTVIAGDTAMLYTDWQLTTAAGEERSRFFATSRTARGCSSWASPTGADDRAHFITALR